MKTCQILVYSYHLRHQKQSLKILWIKIIYELNFSNQECNEFFSPFIDLIGLIGFETYDIHYIIIAL